MNSHLSPNEQKIVDFLEDGSWHCMATPTFFMKDDRARISSINKKGYKIISMMCDKSCGVNHSSQIVMRQMIERPIQKEGDFIKGIGHLKDYATLVAEGII